MRRIFILILLILAQQVSFGQTKKDESKLAKEALSFFNAAQYADAFPLYSQLVSLSPMNNDYAFHFGVCAVYCDADKTNAIKYLKQAEKAGFSNVDLFYFLGRAFHLSYQFSEASRYYELFLDNANPKELEKFDALREIQMCIYATKIMRHPKELAVKKKADSERQGFFRLMNLEAVGGKIITTPNELLNSKDKKSTNPHLVHLNGTPKTLYFSSYSDSSGLDIWQADIKSDGSYGTPMRAPGLVNSLYDEDYPFLHANGKTLYFSSTGHNSMGGYDIFKSELDSLTKKWKKPINIGFSFNTPDDDIFFICDAANQSAIFASGRTSDHNHYSLYQTSYEGKDLEVIYAKANFYSALNPDNASAQIVVKDLETGEIVSDISTDNKTGKFDVYFPKPGRYSYTITVPDQEEKFVSEFDVQPGRSGSVYFPQQVNIAADDKGKNTLVVRNGADANMDNSMENAFAGLLRTKAQLNVSKSETDPSTLERSMTNAPALAGFSKGKSAQDILADMKSEIQTLNSAAPLIENQKMQAYQLANQQFLLSEKAYQASDSIAQAINAKVELKKSKNEAVIFSDEEKAALEKALSLRNSGDQMRIKADAALQLADQLSTYQLSIEPTLKELNAQTKKLQAYINENNVDGTVEVLSQERKRLLQEQSRPKKPSNALPQNAKLTAKAHDNNAKTFDEMVNDLNVLEAKLIEDRKYNNPSLAQTQAASKNKKSEILAFDPKVKNTYDQAQAAKQANMIYNQINSKEDIGLSEGDKKNFTASDISDLKGKVQSSKTKSSEPYKYTLLFDQAKMTPYRNYNLDENNDAKPSDLDAIKQTSNNSFNKPTAEKVETENIKEAQIETAEANNNVTKGKDNKTPVSNNSPYSPNQDDSQDVSLALKSSKVMKQVIDSAYFKEYDYRYSLEEWKFFDILKKYPEISGTYKERAKADSLSKSILETEKAIAKENDPSQKSVLQKKLNSLENQRARIEAENKDIYRSVSKRELDAEKDRATKNYNLNLPKFQKETLLNNFIKQLQNDADSISDLAAIDRKKAETATDPNDKSKWIRSAFSKEMMAASIYRHMNKAIDALPIFELYNSADEQFLLNANPDEIRAKFKTHSVAVNSKEQPTINEKETEKEQEPEVVSEDVIQDLQSLNLSDSDMKKSGIQMETKRYNQSDAEQLLGPRPERIDKPFFVKVKKSAYGPNYPIPVDEPLPLGIVYSVQVGAFRNPIENNTFNEFAPVMGQKLNNGFTRYMAGLFNKKQDALQARNEIRAMGYPDAFVVIYQDGKRISESKLKVEEISTQNTPDYNIPPTTGNGNPINAQEIKNNDDGFYTIQIGVFGRPALEGELKADNLNVEYSASKNLYKYSTGKFKSKAAATAVLPSIIAQGYSDAFVTAYYQGQRISIEKAQLLNFNKKSSSKVLPEKKTAPEVTEKTENKIEKSNVATSSDSTQKEVTKVDSAITTNDDPNRIYEFRLSDMYGIYNCCDENSGECNNPDNKEVIRRFTLISNGSGVAINGKNETTNFQWKYVKDNNNPIQGMEEILGPDYSFYYKNGNIHLGKYCKPKK